jgi:hypothetical protein
MRETIDKIVPIELQNDDVRTGVEISPTLRGAGRSEQSRGYPMRMPRAGTLHLGLTRQDTWGIMRQGTNPPEGSGEEESCLHAVPGSAPFVLFVGYIALCGAQYNLQKQSCLHDPAAACTIPP